MPGDWEAREYLEFHRAFYPTYDIADERNLMQEFRVEYRTRVGNLSAGEIRRLQIVAALAAQPHLVIADEITAVLDIHGRKKFLDLLKERQQNKGVTVILATNVPEGLDPYVDYVFLIHKGRRAAFSSMASFIDGHPDLAHAVLERLESQGA
jgi:ABC-type multidrug transport system ATPase subunit